MRRGVIKTLSGVMIMALVMTSYGSIGKAAEAPARASVKAAAPKAEDKNVRVSGDYKYSVQQDGTVEIVEYTGHSSEVHIPEKIDGKVVTVIGNRAFMENETLNAIYFSKGIKKVMVCAFEGCTNLHYACLNFGLKVLEGSSFSRCDLYSVEIPETVNEVGEFIFFYNKSLKKVKILGGPECLGVDMFRSCNKLETVEFAKNINYTIGPGAFSDCTNLKGFINSKIPEYTSIFTVIPSQINWISDKGLSYCKKIKKLIIVNPNSGLDSNCIDQGTEIYGVKGSYTQKYAEKYNYKFEEFIPTKQITLNQDRLSLISGENKNLFVTYSPTNTTVKEVVWTSSNPNVATVDQAGNVKAISNGTAIISARTFDESNLKQECTVSVRPRLSGIKLDKNEMYLDLSDQKKQYIKAEEYPQGANLGSVQWESSNNRVATVNANGKVYAKGIGKAVITATANGMRTSCTVYVGPKKVKNIRINKTTSNSIEVSWNRVNGVSGYFIYVYDQGSKREQYIGKASSKAKPYTIKKIGKNGLTGGAKYQIRVYSYVKSDGKKIRSAASDIVGYTKPYETKIRSLKRTGGRKNIKVSWKKIKQASYYEIWISDRKNKGYKCVKKTKSTNYTIRKLSKRKRYYIRIRVITKVGKVTLKSENSREKWS